MLATVGQAMARNTHVVMTDDPFTVSGPCTDELLYEVAGHAIIGEICGYQQHGVGSTGGNLVDHHTGLECGFQGEVARATTRAGITREQASEIALQLLPKYSETFEEPKRGKPFAEAYDAKTITPTPEWQDCYRRVKDDLGKMGLAFVQGPWD